MSWSFISDIHVQYPGDNRERMLLKFLKISNKLKVEKIFLLGDIFDFMVGEKLKYIDYYNNFFTTLASLQVKEIHFFEGNHDFHLQSVWNYFQRIYPNSPKIVYHTKGTVVIKAGKRVWLSHGDDIEIGNYSYKVYRFFIRSCLIRIFLKWFIPFRFVQGLGKKMADLSRNYNKYRYNISIKTEEIRKKFRISAANIAITKNVELVIAGHSHVKDITRINNCIYINNGYVPITQCFGLIDDAGEVRHLKI